MTLPRLVRAALAVALVALASGVPQVVSAALADDCCAEHCDQQSDGKQCPPNCTSGRCAKVFPTAVAPAPSLLNEANVGGQPQLDGVVAPSLPFVAHGVFQPPRR